MWDWIREKMFSFESSSFFFSQSTGCRLGKAVSIPLLCFFHRPHHRAKQTEFLCQPHLYFTEVEGLDLIALIGSMGRSILSNSLSIDHGTCAA